MVAETQIESVKTGFVFDGMTENPFAPHDFKQTPSLDTGVVLVGLEFPLEIKRLRSRNPRRHDGRIYPTAENQ